MTVVQLVVLLFVIFIVACAAYWLINKFFKDPTANMIAMLVVGVVLLIVLLVQFFPEAGNFRVWK